MRFKTQALTMISSALIINFLLLSMSVVVESSEAVKEPSSSWNGTSNHSISNGTELLGRNFFAPYLSEHHPASTQKPDEGEALGFALGSYRLGGKNKMKTWIWIMIAVVVLCVLLPCIICICLCLCVGATAFTCCAACSPCCGGEEGAMPDDTQLP